MIEIDDTLTDLENIKKLLPDCNFDNLFTKNDLKIIYTNRNLSSFLDVPLNTKTNMYTIIKRVRLYIADNNLSINGVIKPDKKLSSILLPKYKYNRIINNNLSKYILV